MAAIAPLLQHETGGDPMQDLKWSRRAIRKIAHQLRRLKIRVSATTVRRLLKQLGFSLRVNHKRLESGNKNPPPRRVRNRQFTYIHGQRKRLTAKGQPRHQRGCQEKGVDRQIQEPWGVLGKAPQLVNDHDFPSDAKGRAIPYGIYDPAKNQGFVAMGTSHETPAFAVDAIALWWKSYGQKRYPKVKELLILADAGGGNSARARGWKYHLQHQLVNRYGLKVTVCHYPPGSSKWNPIEHRLFAQISINWAGRPLESYETALNYIRTTRTSTGLTVSARMLYKKYKKGEAISAQQLQQLMLTKHTTLPAWNYTLSPSTM